MESTFRTWYERKMLATQELAEETERVKQILNSVKTIAVVGISKNQHKDSHYVGRYLKNAGYTIVPVNPTADTILGEKAYPDIASIPFDIDVIDIFRRPSDIPGVIDAVLTTHADVVWLQFGTGLHPAEKRRVEQGGKTFIQNRCIKVDHQFLMRHSFNQSSIQSSVREETL